MTKAGLMKRSIEDAIANRTFVKREVMNEPSQKVVGADAIILTPDRPASIRRLASFLDNQV